MSTASAEFKKAAQFKLPFGKFIDQTLDQIATQDKGLLYLDWLIGQEWLKVHVRDPLEIYLLHPTIVQDLDQLLNR